MHKFMTFRCNLLLLFLLLFCISSANAANVINCRQLEAVKRVKRQTAELSSQQQYQQTQRNEPEHRSSQTFSIYQPKVKFFITTPAQQVQQQQVSSGTQQRIVFTTQQLQPAIPVVTQQRQQLQLQQQLQTQQPSLTFPIASPSLIQSTNHQQYFQSNNYLQRQQQQQVYNITNFPRISQQTQQQQQQFQPQQFLQSQQQQLQYYKPQTTTTVTHQNVQRYIANQQDISYKPQPSSQPQYESTPIPNENKGPVSPIFSPLLPSYLDEDDLPLNYTLSCAMCCIPDQSPCQNCCDTNPLLSATVLKSSAG